MRFPLAYYLLLVYLTVIFKPLLPIVSDAYAHIFEEAIHLATVHAKYGNNHLNKDLAHDSDTSNASQKNTNFNENWTVHLDTCEKVYRFEMPSFAVSYGSLLFKELPDIYLIKFVPPPDC